LDCVKKMFPGNFVNKHSLLATVATKLLEYWISVEVKSPLQTTRYKKI